MLRSGKKLSAEVRTALDEDGVVHDCGHGSLLAVVVGLGTYIAFPLKHGFTSSHKGPLRSTEKLFASPPAVVTVQSMPSHLLYFRQPDVPVPVTRILPSTSSYTTHFNLPRPIISSAPQQRPCASSPKAREDRMTPRPAKERRHQNDTKLSATEVPPSSTRKPVRRRMLERKKAAVAVSATSLIPSCSSSVRSVHERKKNAIKKSTRPCVVTAGNSATASANVTGSDAEERKSADTASSGRTRSDDNISSLRGLRLSACSTFKTASSRESPFIDRACPRRLFLQSDSRQGSTVSRGHESDIMTDRTEEYSMCTDSQRRGGEVVSRRRLTVTSPSSSTKRTEQSRKAYLIELAKREKSWHRYDLRNMFLPWFCQLGRNTSRVGISFNRFSRQSTIP